MPECWSWGSFWSGALTMYLVFVIAWVLRMKMRQEIEARLEFHRDSIHAKEEP